MASKSTVNTFEGGLNKDITEKAMPPNSYRDARNVTISGDSAEFALKNMNGSIENALLEITEANYGDATIMAIVECDILNKDASPDVTVPGFAYIVKQEHNSSNLGLIKIFLHIPSTGANQEIYNVGYDSDNFDHPDKLSAFAFAEGGQDYIYFTDTARFIRKIPCILESGTTYSDKETRLIPASSTDLKPVAEALATGTATIVSSGETLSTGTITLVGTGETLADGLIAIGLASTSGDISSVTINSVTVTSGTVSWAGSVNAMATALAANIQAFSSTPNYTASAITNQVTLLAVTGSGSTPNGFVVDTTESGGDITTLDSDMNNGIDSGGITSVTINSIPVTNGTLIPYNTSQDQTAIDLASAIQSYSSTPEYTAVASTNVVTITAEVGSGSTNNGFAVVTTEYIGNGLAATDTPMSGGVSAGDITSLTVDGVEVTNGAVVWDTSQNDTATALALSINTKVSIPNYTAESVANVVTISAIPKSGADPNGFVVDTTEVGNVVVTDVNMSGGVEGTNVKDGGGTKGGNLLYGSYDVYMRLVNENNSKASDWNLMKALMHVPIVTNADTEDGSVGTVSQNYITCSTLVTQDMKDNYTGIQTATVERILGVDTYQTARVTPVGDITGITVGQPYTIEISSNNFNNLISITDLIIDDASIETAEAISTKNNRLIAGGVKYKDLQNNHPNGAPALVAAGACTVDVQEGASEPGYFRGETYRFGIVYFNEDGVYGPVQALDFTGSDSNHNKADFGTDWRFPSRTENHDWSIFRSSSQVANLGINLFEIKNHPTWSKGFVIVRVRRKKNILFQTPLIPTTLVQVGIAYGDFPVLDSAGGTYSATPADPGGTWMPKNFFKPWNYHIEANIAAFGFPKGYGTHYNTSTSPDGRGKDLTTFCVFDSNYMYDVGTPYSFRGTDNVEIQDIALLALKDVDFGTAPAPADGDNNPGNYLRTEIAGQWAAYTGDKYFVSYDDFGAVTPVFDFGDSVTESKIADYQTLSSYGEGVTITKAGSTARGNSSNRFGGYKELQPDGLQEGVTPNNQKMGVICTVGLMPDASHYCATTNNSPHYFANHGFGVAQAFGVSGPNHLTIPAAIADRNDFYTTLDQTTNAVAIANITAGLDDARYGEIDEYHEYISTGHVRFFTPAEIIAIEAGNQPSPVIQANGIMGGDCWITPHTFKLSDGHYSLTNVNTALVSPWADDIERWEKVFSSGINEIQRSNALDKVSQTITVFLESTIRSSILDESVYNTAEADTRFPALSLVWPFPSEASEIKTSFLYDYSSDFSIEGDGRVFFPTDFTVKTNRTFPSRLVYSNQKIYQSFEEGFDKYPVLNFFDLEERYGGIANLHTFKDRLYSFQEDAISYIPIDKNVIETADGIALSLQTGSIIGTPLFVSTYYGSSMGTNLFSTDEFIYIIDRNREAILAFNGMASSSGSSIDNLAVNGMHEFFRGKDYTDMTYDYSRRELLVYDRFGTADGTVLKYNPVVFSDQTKAWVGEVDGLAGDFIGMAWQASDTTGGLLGMTRISGEDDISVHDMYEDASSTSIFGDIKTPYVTYVVNEDILNVKTFDNLAFYSTGELAEAVVATPAPPDTSEATVLLNTQDREGIYRVKALRDIKGRRLRGSYATVNVEWNPDIIAELSHAVMKYRISKRAISKETK